jgi:hypothetical protein
MSVNQKPLVIFYESSERISSHSAMLARGRAWLGAARHNTGKKTNGGRRRRRTNGTTRLSIKEKKVKQWSMANTAAKVFYCFVFAVVSSSMFLRPFINKKEEGLCERN